MRYERLESPGRPGKCPATTTAALRTAALLTAAAIRLREK